MKLRPLRDQILVRRDTAEEKSPGGILLPDNAKQKPQRGEVLAVGPGRLLDSGERAAMQVGNGDVVLFTAWCGHEVGDPKDKDLVLMSEADVLAVVERQ